MDPTFLARLGGFGVAEAIVHDGVPHSYAELTDRITAWRHRFDAAGVQAGEVVALEGPASVEAIAGLAALAERDVIVVPLTPLPAVKRAEFHQLAEVERLVSVVDKSVLDTDRTATHELYEQLRAAGRPGLVLFSSGTTGRSKATVLDLDRLLARYGEPVRPRRTLAFLTLDHIGGINTLLHTLSQGGCLITVADRSPQAVAATIAADRVEVLPTTPTFLNMLLISGAHQHHDLSSLRLITYGTEPMPSITLQRLHEALPAVRLKQTYGLSELGILPTRSRSDGSLWVQLGGPGFEYEVRDGILWIRSAAAMLGYLNAQAPFDERGFFNTQDTVEVDGEYVRILGRKSEIINVAGEKVYPSEVEDVLLDHPDVADVTVSGRPNHITGMVVTATVKAIGPVDPVSLVRELRRHCRGRLEQYKVPVVIEVSDVDHHNTRFKKSRALS